MREGLDISVKSIRHRFHLRMPEWVSAIAMLLCGLVLLHPAMTFDLPHYDILKQIARENVWGGLFLVNGGTRLVVLTLNGALRDGSPWLRLILSITSWGLWTHLVTGVVNAPVPTLTLGLAGALMLAEFINIGRAAGAVANVLSGEHRGAAYGKHP